VSPIVEPPEGSDLIEDWQLFYRLAQRMGLDLELEQSFRSRAGHVELAAPMVTPLDMTREPSTDELYDIVTQRSAVPLEEVRRHEHGRVFAEATQRVAPTRPDDIERLDVGNEAMLAELDEELRERDDRVGPGRPLVLIPRRADGVYNSFGHELVERRHPSVPNPAFMHRDDLAQLGLSPGDEVVLTSSAGSLRAIVATDPDGWPGVISMSHCFGVHAGVRTDPLVQGSNTNLLSSLTDIVDVETGQARTGAIPVALRRGSSRPRAGAW
jgi:anaerobic selenocysteine-containing dehydrogenase